MHKKLHVTPCYLSLEALDASSDRFEALVPNYQELFANLTAAANILHSLTSGGAGGPRRRQVDLPTLPPGPCSLDEGVLPKSTCNETADFEGCNFTISNQKSLASSNTSILPGCPLIWDSFQELFLYCNLRNETRRVTATTCNGQGVQIRFRFMLCTVHLVPRDVGTCRNLTV